MVACQSLDFQFVDERGGRSTRVVLYHFDGGLIYHVEFFVFRHAALHDKLRAKRNSISCYVSGVTYDVFPCNSVKIASPVPRVSEMVKYRCMSP